MSTEGKISVFQMGIMTYLINGATAILIVPSITAQYAGRDMWLSPILSSISGFLIVWITWGLHQLFPGETIIEYSEKILGRLLGKILSFLFLFFLLHTFGTIAREYGEFIVGEILNTTPIVVVIGSMLVVCAFAVRGGIEVIARCAQMFLPIVILFSIIMVLLSIPDFDLTHMSPVMESGWKPAIEGSIIPHVWFIELVLITFLFPVLHSHRKALKGGMVSVLALMVTMVIANLVCLFVLGDVTATFIFPVFLVGTYISIAEFFKNLDAVILVIWVGGGFIQLSVWYYALAVGTARMLSLSDYRPIIFPLGFLALLFSIWDIASLQQLVFFFSTSVIPFAFTVCAAYPLLLLCVAVIRKRLKKATTKGNG
ncbi:Spore germination protein YndE [Paraliobacillus sp. PM-2]|uniref:GerAB/ArcD/ProY family transporter n=1 Tax=Paraliobacillus sp. PM-2 TaxID=1462524 RepID=UPI00061BDBBF|nr:endospore germination permease [Paraliobacillus sp. PM-2]CQR48301.1 Spore germination protein YndE [Paraliobacillus sp. PM-2]